MDDLPSLFPLYQHIGKAYAQMEVLNGNYKSHPDLNYQRNSFGCFELSGAMDYRNVIVNFHDIYFFFPKISIERGRERKKERFRI